MKAVKNYPCATAPNTPATVLAYPDVAAFCAAVGIGRTQAYEEIKAGRLLIAKVGRRTLVPIAEAQRWLAERMVQSSDAA